MVLGRYICNTKQGKKQHSIRAKTRKVYNTKDISSCCVMCGRTDCLVIHHIKYTTDYHQVFYLCGKCHSKLHNKLKKSVVTL